MQIEETSATPRALDSASPWTTPERARASSQVLLLLASFAHLVAVLLGLAAEAMHLQRRFQANTVTNRRVLSLAMLGRLFATNYPDARLRPALSRASWKALALRARAALPS